MIDLGDFTTGQVAFIMQLAAGTGLDPGVCAAWTYAEENGTAAQDRQSEGYHDWLNIGWTDSGRAEITYAPEWNHPTSAGNATANWLKGTWGAQYGYEAAASLILYLNYAMNATSPAAQISQIQQSGWASSGYPLLAEVYSDLSSKFTRALRSRVAKGGVAGGTSNSLSGTAGGGSGTVVDGSSTSTYPFSIGGVDNPDEDYWTGINRLAQEVNWYLFSSGEYLYYLDGEEMLAQQPALTLDRIADDGRFYDSQVTLSWDNTAYSYVSKHKRRFNVQRPTALAIATSPTECNMQLICGIEEVLGGDIIQLTNFGPADGKWVVAECRRSVFDVYSELTLVPPLAPITEYTAAGTTGTTEGHQSTSSEEAGSGIVADYGAKEQTQADVANAKYGRLAKVVRRALAAAALEAKKGCYTYTEDTTSEGSGEVRTNAGNPPLSSPWTYDCSGFCEACYGFAGFHDPAGDTSYLGTSSDIAASKMLDQVTAATAVPGDLVVFPGHVVIYIGGGKCVSMGEQGEPKVMTIAVEASYNHRGITGYFHFKGAK